MADGVVVTREELEQTAKTLELEMDLRSSYHSSDLRLIGAKLDEIAARLERTTKAVEDGHQERQRGEANLRNVIIATGVGVVTAILGIGAAMQSSMLGAFESGKNTASLVGQTADEARKAIEQVNRLREDFDSRASWKPAPVEFDANGRPK